MTYSDIIVIEPRRRGGKPRIRELRVTVYDVLEYLASGMSHSDILREPPFLTEEDILACLAYAADCERKFEISAQPLGVNVITKKGGFDYGIEPPLLLLI